MGRPARWLLVSFLLVVASMGVTTSASAQCALDISPLASPRVAYAVAGRPIALKVRAEACAVYSEPATFLEGGVLAVGVLAYRGPICTIDREVEFALPALPAGNYVLRFEPYPLAIGDCYGVEQVPFGVFPPVAAAVPMLGRWSLALVALLAAMLALYTMRLSHRRP